MKTMLLLRRASLLAAICFCLVSCSHVNPYYDASQPHHRPDGFQDNDVEFEPKSLGDILRWKWQAWRNDLPHRPQAPIPTVTADLSFIHANATRGASMEPAVTWIGHASTLAQIGGINILLDPVFSERASPLSFAGPKREQPPGVALADLPHIELVVISHNHYDHLDAPSVDALNAQPGGPPLFVVPLGLGPWFKARGISNVVELDWWKKTTLSGPKGMVEIDLVPAQHWSARGLGDRMQTLWGGYAIFASDCHLFFAGDTAYSRDFKAVREHFASRQTEAKGGSFDIALIPIGAYEPRWFMKDQHVNPEEAVMIHRDLAAKRSMGVHWGTFQLTDEALDEPPKALSQALHAQGVPAEDFFVLAVGETRKLPLR